MPSGFVFHEESLDVITPQISNALYMFILYILNVVYGIGGSFLPGHYAMKMMPSIECIPRFVALRAVHRSDASHNVLQSHMQDVIKFIYILYYINDFNLQ